MIYIFIIIVFANLLLYHFFKTPKKPQEQEHFDFMLILGCPANPDGSLSSLQEKRIQGASYYYERGSSDTIIFSGGSVKNKVNEAQVMADAFQQLHPNATILLEKEARNTYQNLKHVKAMMEGDHILVISGSSHLRRSYFMVRKFYQDACMGCGNQSDPWYLYICEYTRMWNALYWEVRIAIRNRKERQ